MARDLLFISYSHKDVKHLKNANSHLKALEAFGNIDLWSDRDIDSGDIWKVEIERAISRAKVALLLVTDNFLASDFIRTNELPMLLSAADNDGLRVLWVPIEYSSYKLSPIGRYQSAWSPEKPIGKLSTPNRKKAWVEICGKVLEVFESSKNVIAESDSLPSVVLAEEQPEPEQGSEATVDAIEYEEAMEKIHQVLRSYAPNFPGRLVLSSALISEEVAAENAFRIDTARSIIFGQSGVGKTTTINQLLEAAVFPTTGALTCTRSLAAAQHKDGLIFYDSPGIGDEPKQENITRFALGVDLLKDEAPLERITLLDITAAKQEGPEKYRELALVEFQDELRVNSAESIKKKVVAKEFAPESFRNWQQENPFAFAVFLVSSRRGVSIGDSRLVGDFYRVHGSAGMKIFKVFNIFEEKYRPAAELLPSEIRILLDQAKERLKKAGVPNADDWILIDSHRGHGIDEFVNAFADSLPVEVLKHLALVVRRDYFHLIQARIACYYKDYVALVASLIAVFPADHSDGNMRFVDALLTSLIDVAQFMSPGVSMGSAKSIVNEIIAEVGERSIRSIYSQHRKYKLDNYLSATLSAKLRPVSDYFKLYDNVSTLTDYRYGVGGLASIRLVVPLGVAIGELLSGGREEFDGIWKKSCERIEFFIDQVAEQIKSITRRAGKGEHQSRVLLAEELFPILRSLVEIKID